MNLLARYYKFNFFRQRPNPDNNLGSRKYKRIFISLSRKNCGEILFNDHQHHQDLKVIRLSLINLLNQLAARSHFPVVILIQPEQQDLTMDERYAAKRFAANIAALCKERNWEHYPCLLDGKENGIANLYPNRKDEEHELYLIDDGHQDAFFAEADHIKQYHFKFDWRDELKRKESEQSINTSARMFRDRYEFALVTMTAALTIATVVTSINSFTK